MAQPAPELTPEQRELARSGKCPWCRRRVRDYNPPNPEGHWYDDAMEALLWARTDPATGHHVDCAHKDYDRWWPD